jgi:hypothetical protein
VIAIAIVAALLVLLCTSMYGTHVRAARRRQRLARAKRVWQLERESGIEPSSWLGHEPPKR